MTTTDVLRTVPLFEGMTEAAFDAVTRIAEDVEYEAGSVIVREGEPGDSFIVLVDGRASVEVAGAPVRELGPGDFLGEIALVDGGFRTATVTATEPVRAVTVDGAGFAQLLDEIPALRLDVFAALAHRVREHEPSVLD